MGVPSRLTAAAVLSATAALGVTAVLSTAASAAPAAPSAPAAPTAPSAPAAPGAKTTPLTTKFRYGFSIPTYDETSTGGKPTYTKVATLHFTGSGQINAPHHDASVYLDVPRSLYKGSGVKGPRTLHVIVDGGLVEVNYRGLAAVDNGKPWIGVQLPAKDASAVPPALTEGVSALKDVNEILAAARAEKATVTSLGAGTVDGVAVTGHKVVFELTSTTPASLGAVAQILGSASAPAQTSAEPTVTAELWSAAGGHVIRATGSLSEVEPPLGTLTLAGQADFRAYGQPAHIALPLPSQVKRIPWSSIAGTGGATVSALPGALSSAVRAVVGQG